GTPVRVATGAPVRGRGVAHGAVRGRRRTRGPPPRSARRPPGRAVALSGPWVPWRLVGGWGRPPEFAGRGVPRRRRRRRRAGLPGLHRAVRVSATRRGLARVGG